ncbi:MAG: thiopurine S-methyltransferase [Pseudomonadota bacterium]|nr:thiopurine S-methyltransferase [Pseudomonadota bacterium]
MKPRFWLERWQKDQVGFHQADYNPVLMEYWPSLNLTSGAKVFVPLCGKSLDMRWLESEGHDIVGVEIARQAIDHYFRDESEVRSTVADRFVSYRGRHTEILHGDFFDLMTPLLSGVEAVFDRAALIALPPGMRVRYADHMLRIIPEGAKILLITLEYDQGLIDGPPHAVDAQEVEGLYGRRCDVALLEAFITTALPPHFEKQGIGEAIERVYKITKRE